MALLKLLLVGVLGAAARGKGKSKGASYGIPAGCAEEREFGFGRAQGFGK